MAILLGLLSDLLIGSVAENYTSSSYMLVRRDRRNQGAAEGHGYHLRPSFGSHVYHHSRPGPVVMILVAHSWYGIFGVALDALGMLGALTWHGRGTSVEYLVTCPTLASAPVSDRGNFSVVVMVSMVIPSNLAWVRSGDLAAATVRLITQRYRSNHQRKIWSVLNVKVSVGGFRASDFVLTPFRSCKFVLIATCSHL